MVINIDALVATELWTKVERFNKECEARGIPYASRRYEVTAEEMGRYMDAGGFEPYIIGRVMKEGMLLHGVLVVVKP